MTVLLRKFPGKRGRDEERMAAVQTLAGHFQKDFPQMRGERFDPGVDLSVKKSGVKIHLNPLPALDGFDY